MSSDTIPDLIGTVEDPAIPFSSINVLKEYSVSDKAYKAFSRAPLSDELLDKFFRYGRFFFTTCHFCVVWM
jgi:prenylcysteine oxidase/farnesylcysteine lyase